MIERAKPVAAPAPDAGFDASDAALRALLSGIAGRDEAGLAALYDATAERLYALALRIVSDHAGAEEVVADVYFQVWEQAGRYDPARAKVMHWLYMICRSRALDHLRRRDCAQTAAEPEALRADSESMDRDPLDLLAGMQRDSAVHAALQALPPPQRQLLMLAFFRDMSHQEIAAYTGMPLGSVKTMLRRSMQNLRDRLMNLSATMGTAYGRSR